MGALMKIALARSTTQNKLKMEGSHDTLGGGGLGIDQGKTSVGR
jgi:hypothetical protein